MSPRQPRITADQMLRALQRDGWSERARRGSHVHLTHPSKPGRVTVPVHAGETLQPWLLASILRQAGLTVEDLRTLL